MKISAILPTYNGADRIRTAIESVLGQTLPVDEIIIVDDGSTDNTSGIIRTYGDKIRYLYQQNQGAAAARNFGIQQSTGDWIAFIDHDDQWLPTKIERQVAAVSAKSEAVLCYTWSWVVSGEKRFVAQFLHPDNLWPRVRLRSPFPPNVVMAKRVAVEAVGGFTERLRASCEDWDLWVRLAARFPTGFVSVEEPLAIYNMLDSSSSKRYKRVLDANLSIVEETLLTGLSGSARSVWRRKIRSSIYYQAAVGARDVGDLGLTYLLHSFLEWPAPTFEPIRLKTLTVELLGK